jgi:quinolinate synthase
LGRNTAIDMGISETEMCLWTDNASEYGGNSAKTIRKSRIILWDGFCCIHQRIQTEWIDTVREKCHDIRVIVHPECSREVVARADETGSTNHILRRVTESPPKTKWAIGTESRFVERLARQNPDKTIIDLSPQPNYCRSMSLTHLGNLSKLIHAVESEKPYNIISVNENIAPEALQCLQRMLQCR